MYEPPVTVLQKYSMKEVSEAIDDYIFNYITEIGVDVNKDELIKALKYDRDQYDKGFKDGRDSTKKEIIRCKDCMYYRTHGAFGIPLRKEDRYCSEENFPDEGQKELPEWWFCAGAKRKQNTDQGGE